MLTPFFIREKKVLTKIHPETVVWIEAKENYIDIYLSDGKKHTVRSTLAGALEKLPPEIFIQINRSEVVSIYYIDTIDKYNLKISVRSFTITRQFYKDVIEKLIIIEGSKV